MGVLCEVYVTHFDATLALNEIHSRTEIVQTLRSCFSTPCVNSESVFPKADSKDSTEASLARAVCSNDRTIEGIKGACVDYSLKVTDRSRSRSNELLTDTADTPIYLRCSKGSHTSSLSVSLQAFCGR